MKNIFLIILFLLVAGCSISPPEHPKFKVGDIVHYKYFPEVKCFVKRGPSTYNDLWLYELVCKSNNQENTILQDRKAFEWEIE